MSVDQEERLAELFLQREVEALYTLEAELLDERRFTEWLELFADDARYWMPIPRNLAFNRPGDEYTREQTDANWFDEGKDDLTKRVQQILGGDHWAEEPRSRTTHVTSNVSISGEADGQLTAHSRFFVSQSRQEHEVTYFVGKRIDKLRRTDRLQIIHRTIYIDQSVLLAKGLTTFF